MGRIKTDVVKRNTAKLIKAHPTKFSKNFERNKESLNELAEVRSKKLRNVIAGYAVRLKKQEAEGPKIPKRSTRTYDMGERRPERRFDRGQGRRQPYAQRGRR